MNASSNSANDFIRENSGGSRSDSDTNDDEETPEFYQPISAAADDDDDDDEELNSSDRQNSNSDNEHDPQFHSLHHHLPNGYLHPVENGLLALDLSDEDEDDCEEEEERTREEYEVAMRRAFRDDDSRRNAPLPPENAARVMEAMRGISFGGFAPDWVGRIPEDQWTDQLGRIRQSIPPPSSTVEE